MSRRDDIDILYKKSSKLDEWCRTLFWTNCNFAIISLLFEGLLNSVGVLMQIITTFLYIILKCLDDGHYWYNAESARRKNNLQDAFGINLSNFETEGYYNNSLEPSVTKYAMNTFESVLFTKEIVSKMLFKSMIRSLISIIVLISVSWFKPNQGIFLSIVQTVFSAFIVEETVMLTFYKSKLEKLYELIYAEFITVGITKKVQQTLLLSYAVDYEATKAHYKIRINTYLFKLHNEELSKKWDEIKSKCKIKNRLS